MAWHCPEDRGFDHPLGRHPLTVISPAAQRAAVGASLLDVLAVDAHRGGSEKADFGSFLGSVNIDTGYRRPGNESRGYLSDQSQCQIRVGTTLKHQDFY